MMIALQEMKQLLQDISTRICSTATANLWEERISRWAGGDDVFEEDDAIPPPGLRGRLCFLPQDHELLGEFVGRKQLELCSVLEHRRAELRDLQTLSAKAVLFCRSVP